MSKVLFSATRATSQRRMWSSTCPLIRVFEITYFTFFVRFQKHDIYVFWNDVSESRKKSAKV